jgi:ATP-dependent Clp protease ATP-binding subunit ClpC
MKMSRRPYLTTRAHEAFSLAFDAAANHAQAEITSLHLTLGILREGHGVAIGMLRERGVPLDDLAGELEAALPVPDVGHPTASAHAWTPAAERLIAAAQREARLVDTEYYGVEHLLLAMLRDEASAPAQAIARHGVRAADIEAGLRRLLSYENDHANGGQRAADPPPLL